MVPVSRAVVLFALSICFVSFMAAAQSAPAGIVTAGPARDGIRVTAAANIVHTRVQAFTSGGSLVYDSGWRDGNVFDWALQDSFGHALAFDSYGITVMARDVAGHVAVRNGILHFAPGDVRVDGDDFTRDRAPAMVRLAHTGAIGQIVTTEGALSFHFGDFMAGNDVEAMRLSPTGDLDVAGVVRAGRGIQFPDGTIQQTAAIASVVRLPGTPGYQPAASATGNGTTNKIAKWIDDLGTLGDSTVSEVGGRVGIGTTTPGSQLHVFGNATSDVFAGLGPNVNTGPAMNYGYSGNTFGRGSGFFNVRPDALATAPNPSLRFMTANQQRVIITNLGNVGIGTFNPTNLLEVNGNVKMLGSGQLIFPDATSMGTAGATLGANTFNGDQNVTGKVIATSDVTSGGVVSGASASFTGNIVSTSGSVGAATQFNIGGQRVLSLGSGGSTLIIGQGAGASNSTAGNLVFVGPAAGAADTTGFRNVFVGPSAGTATTSGGYNTMVDYFAGASNTQGIYNSFFGDGAGFSNTTSSGNSYFGLSAGLYQTGGANSFFGQGAAVGQLGSSNGSFNVAVGTGAGYSLTSGSNNTFLGARAGTTTTVENDNVAIGLGAATAGGVSNGTAIGSQAFVGQNNSVVLGAVNGQNGATVSARVGIGQTVPYTTLHVRADAPGALGPILTLMNGGAATGAGAGIDFDGLDTGANPPSLRIQSADDGAFSSDLIFLAKTPGNIANALAERMRLTSTGILSINQSIPDTNAKLHVNGKIHLDALGSAGSESLCRNSSNLIGTCGASSIRLKDNVADYTHGIDLIRQLRPVSFTWKSDHKEDFGLIAEEVEKVEPRLSVYDSNGVVEGVRYDRLTPLLVSAVKELADDRDRLKHENDDLRERLAAVELAIAKLAPTK
ncbi:MAG: tail fiber domain-containing protein [Thermoanaerobaculia bacterium]